MNAADISVTICTRDRPEYIRACLGSIRDGSSLPGEVWVIDQSSDDRSSQVVDEFLRDSELPLHYYRHNGIGHTSARNTGARLCLSPIIAYTDDDCLVDKSWLSHMAKAFEEPSVNCVCGMTIPADHTDRPPEAHLSTFTPAAHKVVRSRCNPLAVGRGNNMAFRRADLLALGGFNETIGVGTSLYAGDDTDIFYRLVQAGGAIAVVPEAIVYHAQPESWQMVMRKKRGYAVSFAAIFAIKAVQGDAYAGALLSAKLMYESIYLFLGGALTMRGRMAEIGWHSMMGSLSGIKHVMNRDFRTEMRRLSVTACAARLDMVADVPSYTTRTTRK